MILRDLMRFGLPEKRARLYLAALELGEAPVTEVAKRAKVGRTSAYDLLAALEAEGLVTQIDKAGKTHVLAENPQILAQQLAHRHNLLQNVLPELQAIHDGSLVKPRVRYYPGRDGVLTVLEDTLLCRSGELKGILSMQELLDVPGMEYMEENIRRRVAAGIRLRVVRSRLEETGDIWPSSAEQLRETRLTATDTPFTMTSYIYDDKVAYLSSRRENFALLIQSAELAGLATQLFEMLWLASEPYP